MTITINGKRSEFRDFIKSREEFIELLKSIYNKVNFESSSINSLIDKIYNTLLNENGNVRLNRLDRWLPGQFGFQYSNRFQLEYWLERGFSEKEFQNSILEKSQMVKRSMSKFRKEESIIRSKWIPEYSNKYRFNNTIFESNNRPKCNTCNSPLNVYQSSSFGDKFWEILGCQNTECQSNNEKLKDLRWKSFLPQSEYIQIKNNLKSVKRSFSKYFWMERGYTEEEAVKKQFEIQSNNSKRVKNRPGKSKENLRKKGYTEEEIRKSCLTMANPEFWIDRGYSDADAIEKVRSHQSNAAKYVDFEKRVLPTNKEYWIDRGYSEEESVKMVSERQKTFSKEKCIQKWGEEKGIKVWKSRQEKWMTNYKKSNFSKISQDLFQEVYGRFDFGNSLVYFATLKNGKIDESGSNNEFRLELSESYILPDFFVPSLGKIIEFDGVYYHRNTPENKKREIKRDFDIINSGYEVLHVSEIEYKNNRESTIQKCIDFLNS